MTREDKEKREKQKKTKEFGSWDCVRTSRAEAFGESIILRMRYAESVTGRYVSRARKMAGGPNFDSSLCGHEARPNSVSVALGCLYGPKWRRIFVGSSRARWPSVWSPVKAKRCPTVRVCAGVAPDECCRSWCCHVRRRVWRRWW